MKTPDVKEMQIKIEHEELCKILACGLQEVFQYSHCKLRVDDIEQLSEGGNVFNVNIVWPEEEES